MGIGYLCFSLLSTVVNRCCGAGWRLDERDNDLVTDRGQRRAVDHTAGRVRLRVFRRRSHHSDGDTVWSVDTGTVGVDERLGRERPWSTVNASGDSTPNPAR